MPAVSVDHLTVILRMACAQAEVPLDRKGFKDLTDRIDDQYAPLDEDIDQRFVDEHIYKPLQKARADGNKTVSLGLPKVHKLCNYLGFRDYEHFQQEWLRVGKFLKKKAFQSDEKGGAPHFRSIHDAELEQEAVMHWAGALYPEQAPNKDTSLLLSEPDANELTEYLSAETGVLWVADSWMNEEVNAALANWLLAKERSGCICVVWNMEKAHVKKNLPHLPEELVLSNHLLPLIIQVLQYYSEEAGNRGPEDELNKGQSINITDSGAVFLGGKNTVNADNVAHRDMHITIHNKK